MSNNDAAALLKATARRKKIVQMRRDGLFFREIGAKFGFSTTRARALYLTAIFRGEGREL